MMQFIYLNDYFHTYRGVIIYLNFLKLTLNLFIFTIYVKFLINVFLKIDGSIRQSAVKEDNVRFSTLHLLWSVPFRRVIDRADTGRDGFDPFYHL